MPLYEKWLERYGESIYETRGGPFEPSLIYNLHYKDDASYYWGGSTHRGNKIYIHVLNWINDVITLPNIEQRIVSSSSLTAKDVTVKQTDEAITVSVPPEDRSAYDTIIVLELDEPFHWEGVSSKETDDYAKADGL